MNALPLRQAILALGWLLAVDPWLAAVLPGHQAIEASKKEGLPPPKRYPFDIDPKTPLADLLPTAPDLPAALPPWLVRDLSQTPEVLFQKVVSIPVEKRPANFDFLVRTREVSSAEVDQYQAWRAKQGADYVAPNQEAALLVLRGLTRRDAGRSAAAWRKELGL